MQFTVHGLEEAKAKLGQLGYLVDSVVDDAIEEAAEPMRQQAQDRAPRLTGKLAESMTLHRIRKHEWSIGADPRSNVYWDLFQELGTRHHAAQPFLRPAFEGERMSTIDRFGRFLRRIIEGVGR